jgi:hypothetical protein
MRRGLRSRARQTFAQADRLAVVALAEPAGGISADLGIVEGKVFGGASQDGAVQFELARLLVSGGELGGRRRQPSRLRKKEVFERIPPRRSDFNDRERSNQD